MSPHVLTIIAWRPEAKAVCSCGQWDWLLVGTNNNSAVEIKANAKAGHKLHVDGARKGSQ